MPESTPRTLNHFAFFKFKDAYFALSSEERQGFKADWLAGLRQAAEPTRGTSNVDVYQVYPAETSADVLVWSAIHLHSIASLCRRRALVRMGPRNAGH